jgi:Na+/serine symporter
MGAFAVVSGFVAAGLGFGTAVVTGWGAAVYVCALVLIALTVAGGIVWCMVRKQPTSLRMHASKNMWFEAHWKDENPEPPAG